MSKLFRDFWEQSWAMKIVLGWGWLAVIIMTSSFAYNLIGGL